MEMLSENLKPAFSKDNIVVLLCSDDNYAAQLTVVLYSIINNRVSHKNYDIIIFEDNIKQYNIDSISNLANNCDNVAIRFVNPSNMFKKTKIRFADKRFTMAACFRLSAPYILTNYDKVLYMDVDIICKSDISELYDTNLQDKYAAAVLDLSVIGATHLKDRPFYKDYIENTIGLKEKDHYFNSGVMLMNLKTLREKIKFEDIITCASMMKYLCVDQDPLNMLFEGHMLFEGSEWNLFTYSVVNLQICIDACPQDYQYAYYAARKSPKLIHYAGHIKPWNCPEEDFAAEFWKIARKTDVYEILLHRLIKHETAQISNPHNVGKMIEIARKLFPYGTRRNSIVKRILRFNKNP